MPIVYDGVNGDGQGDLFDGIKFWIARRVPQRQRWLKLVEGNGGKVVRLEKQADMLIADNIENRGVGCPPGSYSWKWIDCSVKNGFLEDKSDYLIGRPENVSRAVGSSEPAKSTRRSFTQQDDLILSKWVTASENMECRAKGNTIYQELEKKHPHHTWQAWRYRWIKKGSNMPRPSVPDMKVDHNVIKAVAAMNGGSTVQFSGALRRSPRRPKSTLSAASLQVSSLSSLHVAVPRPPIRTQPGRSRAPFTKEDDRLLLAHIREARAKNEYLSGNKIYQLFAQKYPSHPWHAWRDRWVRHLSLREPVDDVRPDYASSVPPDDSDEEEESTVQPQRQKQTTKGSADLGSSSAELQPNSRYNDKSLKRQEEQRRQACAATLLQRAWRGHAARKQLSLGAAVVPLQAMIRGCLIRDRQAQMLVEASEAGTTTLKAQATPRKLRLEIEEHACDLDDEAGIDEADKAAREEFYQDFSDYSHMIGVEPKRELNIDAYVIDAWDLFRIATHQASKANERDWSEIADSLGLGSGDFPGAAQSLRDWYHDNLAGFEEAIKEYDKDEDMEDVVDDVLSPSNAVTATKQPVSYPAVPICRSLPQIAASKRTLNESKKLSPSDISYSPDFSRKRRRLNKSTEIPATPEDRLETGRNPARLGQNRSSLLDSRLLGSEREVAETSSEEDSDGLLDEDMEEVEEVPTQTRSPPRRFVEPRTQEWHFGVEHQVVSLDSVGDDDKVSPFQQLITEPDAKKVPKRTPDGQAAACLGPDPPRFDKINRKGSETRMVRSSPGRCAAVAVAEAMSRGPSHQSRPQKRTLPLSYRQEPTSMAITPARDYIHERIPVPSSSTRPPPAQRTHSSTGRQSPFDSNAPSLGYLPSSSAIALPVSMRNGLARPGDSEPLFDCDFVDAQINHFESMGYKKSHILKAMVASTFQRGPMVAALESLSKRRGIPANEPGVWTTSDDEDLRLVIDHERQMEKGKNVLDYATLGKMKVKIWAARNRLDDKHGKVAMGYRRKYKQLELEHLMSWRGSLKA